MDDVLFALTSAARLNRKRQAPAAPGRQLDPTSMDFIYSLMLLIALIAGGLGALPLVLLMVQPKPMYRVLLRTSRLALICGAVSLVFGLLSALVHFSFGHGPGSSEPMQVPHFLWHHKSYWLVLALVLLSCCAGLMLSRIPPSSNDNGA